MRCIGLEKEIIINTKSNNLGFEIEKAINEYDVELGWEISLPKLDQKNNRLIITASTKEERNDRHFFASFTSTTLSEIEKRFKKLFREEDNFIIDSILEIGPIDSNGCRNVLVSVSTPYIFINNMSSIKK